MTKSPLSPTSPPPENDPFARFRAHTRARIGLGRTGDAVPTSALLDFQFAHAQARDAVHAAVDWEQLKAQFGQDPRLAGRPVLTVQSRAADRDVYLRRPDLGRRLEAAGVGTLMAERDEAGGYDIAFVVADGLSATAISQNAAATLGACVGALSDWSIAPLVLASQARVALADEVAQCLNARMVAVLIGERPGLSVAESLGIYLTHAPRVGRRDSERNCISNIHADGSSPQQAAELLAWLARQGRTLGMTGIDLKPDERVLAAAGADPVLGQ
jgi:ethanolamine ammonia-lyase small subunit